MTTIGVVSTGAGSSGTSGAGGSTWNGGAATVGRFGLFRHDRFPTFRADDRHLTLDAREHEAGVRPLGGRRAVPVLGR